MARKPKGWHPENIKAELRKKFGSMARFAAANSISLQSVSGALASPIGSSRVEQMIADGLQVQAHELWPDRWTSEGQKIDRSAVRRKISKRNAV